MTALRDRREDLGLLIAALLKKSGVKETDNPRIAPDLGMSLLSHDWPLNVRELEQLLTRTWLLAEAGLMSGEADFVRLSQTDESPTPASVGRPRALTAEETAMQQRLTEALTSARGNVTEAARALGTGRVQFHRLMKRLGIDARRFRP
jgi:DNA-binding NtrC family response regulator